MIQTEADDIIIRAQNTTAFLRERAVLVYHAGSGTIGAPLSLRVLFAITSRMDGARILMGEALRQRVADAAMETACVTFEGDRVYLASADRSLRVPIDKLVVSETETIENSEFASEVGGVTQSCFVIGRGDLVGCIDGIVNTAVTF